MNLLTLILLAPAIFIVLTIVYFVVDSRTSSGDSGPLREEIKKRFHPELERRGYRRKSNSSVSIFRRTVGCRIRIVELRWDKNRRPAFSLTFGETPNTVLSTHDGEVAPENVQACYSQVCGELQRSERHTAGNGWFKLRKPLMEVLTTAQLRYKPSIVVDDLLSFYPEIEQWFETQQVGPHVRFLWHEAQRVVPAELPPAARSAGG